MDVLKDLLHADQFIVELVVSAGIGQEGVSVGYEQIEDLDHLLWEGDRATYAVCTTSQWLLLHVLYYREYCYV